MKIEHVAQGASAVLATAGVFLAEYGLSPLSVVTLVVGVVLALASLEDATFRLRSVTAGFNFCAGLFGAPVLIDHLDMEHPFAIALATFAIGYAGHSVFMEAGRFLRAYAKDKLK